MANEKEEYWVIMQPTALRVNEFGNVDHSYLYGPWNEVEGRQWLAKILDMYESPRHIIKLTKEVTP